MTENDKAGTAEVIELRPNGAQTALGATETAPQSVPTEVHVTHPVRVKRVVSETTGRVRTSRTYRKDDQQFAGFVRRMIRAYARRAAKADPTVLADMVEASRQLDEAMVAVVAGLRAQGYSWQEIARELGADKANTRRKFGPLIGEVL